MKSEQITKAYELAKARYADLGIDTEKVLEQLQNFHLSMHCWQADDVAGFGYTVQGEYYVFVYGMKADGKTFDGNYAIYHHIPAK